MATDDHHDDIHAPQIVVIHHKHDDDEVPHGTWKIAYADMVTALMAFFLLLWILSSTEKEILDGYSNYFTPTILTEALTSGSAGIFGGDVTNDDADQQQAKHTETLTKLNSKKRPIISWLDSEGEAQEESTGDDKAIDFNNKTTRANVNALATELAKTPLPEELQNFDTPIETPRVNNNNRLRLIPDEGDNAFFPGTDMLKPEITELLQELAIRLISLPNNIVINGYPDNSTDFNERWALAINRANAVRRVLVNTGLEEKRFHAIIGIGKADDNNENNIFDFETLDIEFDQDITSRSESKNNMRFDIILLDFNSFEQEKLELLPPGLLNF